MPVGGRLASQTQLISRHQACNTIFAGGLSSVREVLVHTQNAERALAVFVHLTDAAKQPVIVALPLAWLAQSPLIKAAGRDLWASTHDANGKLIATTLDRLIFQDDSLAKNVAAWRKKPAPRHPGQLPPDAGQLLIPRTARPATTSVCRQRLLHASSVF